MDSISADFDLDRIDNVCVGVIWMRNVQSYPLFDSLWAERAGRGGEFGSRRARKVFVRGSECE